MSLQENPDLEKILKKLKGLSKQAYYLPDFWVCEVCAELHPVDNDDTPTFCTYGWNDDNDAISCPLGQLEWGRRAYADNTGCRVDRRLYQIDHRHVQSALKLTRMKDIASVEYIKAILHDVERTYQPWPRIIEDYGGTRFLTKSSWDFIRKPSDDTVGKALAAKGQEYTNSCTSCPTDYLIRMVDCGAEVRAWQDFGTEGSPASQLWRSHCTWSLESTTEKQRPSQPAARAPGYIRNIYDFGPSPAFLQQLLPP
ncbi:hypothetical protein F5X98DRAFT_376552 [Xylaria grammica]|nr:hypothetical protein F5X98DRAFT_376552 [Xylaria grammica]